MECLEGEDTLLHCPVCWPVLPHLCAAPIADHEVEWGGVLSVDEGAVEADRAPAGVGHLGLVPEARKFKCHALDIGQILCHLGNM